MNALIAQSKKLTQWHTLYITQADAQKKFLTTIVMIVILWNMRAYVVSHLLQKILTL